MTTEPETHHPDEGTWKFDPRYCGEAHVADHVLEELNRWREKLYGLELIGAFKGGELDGIGFGNISMRVGDGFVITASDTGHLSRLEPKHYAEVVAYDLSRNRVEFRAASEAATPSAETMTHGAFYTVDPGIGAVVHVHHLAFWEGLLDVVPTTRRDVTYGTPAMAEEVMRLYREGGLDSRCIVAMGGHVEGVITCGTDLDQAGALALEEFAKSR